jgi:hypothetical protein
MEDLPREIARPRRNSFSGTVGPICVFPIRNGLLFF